MSRLGRIIKVLSGHSVNGSLIAGVCGAAIEILAVDAAGLALLINGQSSTLCANGTMAEVGELAQFTLGEGPCREAFESDVLIESTHLLSDHRWPMFASGMVETGAQSVASFPVRVGGARIGALTVYRRMAGRLTSEQAADGYVLAHIAAHVITSAEVDAGNEAVVAEMEAGFARMEPVHQATGMIMAHWGVSAEEALTRLRAAAFAAGLPVTMLAREIIQGRIDLIDDQGERREPYNE